MSLRSRSGCVTFRAKHLKCDESKPSCQLCSTRGVECGGYHLTLRWSRKHEDPSKNVRRSAHTRSRGPSQRWSRTRRQSGPGTNAVTRNDAINHDTSSNDTTVGNVVSDPLDLMSFSGADQPTRTALDPTSCDSSIPELPQAITDDPGDLGWSLVPSDPIEMTQESGDLDVADAVIPSRQTICPLSIPPEVNDVSISLIEYWFRDVCGLWSQYDSDFNFNRIIAATLWSTSAAVSTSLRGMSSAYLSTKGPHMQKTAISLMKEATKTISLELLVVKSSHQLEVVPLGLLYGLLCVGTSICWLNATHLGIPLLREAKALLYRINQQSRDLSSEEWDILRTLNRSWAYCELLLSMVADTGSFSQYDIDKIQDVSVDQSPTAQLVQPVMDHIPHPWTGVSTIVTRILTEIMRLCRGYRMSLSQDLFTNHQFMFVEEARALKERLLDLHFEAPAVTVETGDQRTPVQHLVNVAEAYQLVGLIHIYQTFPDLADVSDPNNPWAAWDEFVTPLSLRLVKLIDMLPADSGCKMTQPLLCITASTGLRFGSKEAASKNDNLVGSATGDAESIENCDDMLEYIDHLVQADEALDHLTLTVESRSEILSARCFLMNRLEVLGIVLPPRPIAVAKKLVQAIWNEYNNEGPVPGRVHWVDIMEKNNLRSLFG
ncbi:hypothetical protein CEP51_004981 [Fusarium floridanum]|uniref:Zn(2)-C6 fungal-type domain-containing protein n=1 Tax=Fusarium floridanum TaxID=1325733 RepID=A0A428RYR6_9HYPO|nr:hypothetical protein CEP51_004981 [Fusarium floridanum]